MENMQRTNLAVPDDLREDIEACAKGDLRPYKAEIIVLLREAVETRKKKGTKSG